MAGMRTIVISTALLFALSLSATASALPRSVFSLTDIEQARAQAAKNKQPLVFVITDLDSNCGLCVSATADIFKSFRSVGTLVHIKNKGLEISNAPEAVRKMYQDPAVGRTIPITLVTTADASKAIKILSYDAVKGGNASKEARNLRRELEGIDPLGTQGVPNSPLDAGAPTPELLAEEQVWENSEGKRITAAVKKVDQGAVLFVMTGGREVSYPIHQLSAASREKIEGLAKP